MIRRQVIKYLGCATVIGAMAPARAQERFPSRPITLVVPFAAGGGGDTTARLLAKSLGDRLGGSVIVENRAGASGNIGAAYVMRAPPDGYTLLSLSSTYGIQASINKMGFDPLEMQPIVLATRDPLVLLVHPSAPWRTVAELVAAARKTPDAISHGSAGAGSIAHLGMEELGHITGAKFLHVPYKGSSAAMTDLLGRNVQLVLTTTTFASPYIKTGKVRALGLSGSERLPALPDVPTFNEQGFAYAVFDWKAIAGPKGMPAALVAKLNEEFDAILRSPAFAKRMEADGSSVVGGPPAQLAQTLRSDIDRWKALIKTANIRIE